MKIQLPQTIFRTEIIPTDPTFFIFSAIAPHLVGVSLCSVVRQLKTADMIPLRIILSTEKHDMKLGQQSS